MPSKRSKKTDVSRARAEEIERLVEAAIQGEQVDGLIKALSQPDQDLFWDVVNELRLSTEGRMEELYKFDYIRTPPSMEEFLDDPYWLGARTQMTEENPNGIYPKWRELLCRDFNFDSKINNLVLTGSLGCGKCWAAGERVLRPDFSSEVVEKIKVGDQLLDDRGVPQTVVSLARGEDEMYLIKPTKGEPFTVNSEHVLVLVHTNSGEELEIAVKDFLRLPKSKQDRYKLFRVPVEAPERPVGIDPYRLGLRLGDGLSHDSIPQEYLHNSREVRKKLLAGILDSDARCPANGCYEICFKYPSMGYQVATLARSLGYGVTCKMVTKTIKKIGFSGQYLLVYIFGANDVPCLLPRKKSGPRLQKKNPLRTGFKIAPAGRGKYYGFTLTGSGRVLMHDFTVSHNSYNMCIIFLYRVVLTRLLRNPQSFLGLNRGSKIFFTLLSVSKQVVEQTVFGEVKDFMSMSRFFIDECGFEPDKNYSNFCVPLGKNIFVSAGSKGWHTIGRNVMGICLDEGNFRNEKDADESAYKLYDDARVRLQNRFQRTKGYLPAISILASSARDESSFTERAIADIRVVNNPKLETVYRHAAYYIKRGTKDFNLSDRWFRVSYGLKSVDPVVLGGWCKEDGSLYPGSPPLEQPPQGAQIEIVPDLYYDAFRRNTKTQLQAISGIATGGSFRLMQSMVDVETCITKSSDVTNPCHATHIPLSMDDDMNIWDFLDHKKFLTRVLSRIRPARHPDVPRFAHIDLATVNMAGLAICHPVGQQLIEGLYTPDAVQPFSEYRLVVEYDFILTIVAGPNRPISLEKVQKFFFWLREQCGFHFNLVTADQYQCLSGTTLVDTSRGLVPISEVRIGDFVQSRSGPRRVINTVRYAACPMLKLTTRNGDTITGTPNHKLSVFTPDGPEDFRVKFQWRELKDIKPGDVIEVVKSPVDVEGVDNNLAPMTPHKTNPKGKLKGWTPPEKITPALAEWLGLMYGDGNWGPKSGRMSLSAHPTDARCATRIFETLFGVSFTPTAYKKRKALRLDAFSVRVVRWMLANGFQKPSRKCKNPDLAVCRVPDLILKGSRPVQAAFLRGLLSADAHISKDGIMLTLSTCQYRMARDVMNVLRTQFGIESHILSVDRAFKKGDKVKRQYMVHVKSSRQLFFDKIGFCYESKQAVLRKNLHVRGRDKWALVKSIESANPDYSYDIQVEGDPSYTANGFVSHNSTLSLQMMSSRGFATEQLSLDKNKGPYYAWRDAWTEHRIRTFRQSQMMTELENLVDGPKKIDHPPEGSKDTCIVGSTKIYCVDGNVLEIKDMEIGQSYWVYSIQADGSIGASRAVALGITRPKAQLVRVTLDNGEHVDCTPDHLFMLRDGSYARADSLQKNTSLMPFHASERRVVSVIPLENEQPVYCLRVEGTSNFALQCGVFIHNCDAAAGAYWNAISSDTAHFALGANSLPLTREESVHEEEPPPVSLPIPKHEFERRRVTI